MIGAIFAAALANSITAPPGLWARARWGETRPNISLQIENRSKVVASLVDINCKAYDAQGALVGAPSANLARLGPGEAARTWATDATGATAVRFDCQITVDTWLRRNEPAH
jgi:hypothetical protein